MKKKRTNEKEEKNITSCVKPMRKQKENIKNEKRKLKIKRDIKTIEDETHKNRSKMLGRARLSRPKMKKKHTSKIRKNKKSKLIDKLLLVVR